MLKGEMEFKHHDLLNRFCKAENLDLKIILEEDVYDDETRSIFGVFRRRDIDVIVTYIPKMKRFDMACKKSNLLIDKFEAMASRYHKVRVVRTIDTESVD
jgi:hypothetical protein